MQALAPLFRSMAIVFLCIPFHTALSADPGGPTSSQPTPELLTAKIKQVETMTDLDAAIKENLIELYHRTISYLETEQANIKTAKNYLKEGETAPLQARKIRERLEQEEKKPAKVTLKVSQKTPLPEVEQLALKEKAHLAALETNLAEVEARLALQTERPATARLRLATAKQQLEELITQLKRPVTEKELPLLTEAKRWKLQTQTKAINTEIKMLDQELLSHTMRLDLLKARKDLTESSIKRIVKRVDMLEEMVNQGRRTQADKAQAEAEAVKRKAAGKHPLVKELAEDNARLGDELRAMVAELELITAEEDQASKEAKRIGEELRSTKQKFEIAGLSQAIGQVLLKQRQGLPAPRLFNQKIQKRERLIADSGLRQLRHHEERGRLRSISDYVDVITAKLPQEEIDEIRGELTNLARKRRGLLDQEITTDNAYLSALGELDFTYRQLIDAVDAYNRFLDEHLLWIRSAPPVSLSTFDSLHKEIALLLSPIYWLETWRVLTSRVTQSPIPALALLLTGLLLWKARQFRRALLASGEKVGKPTVDNFTFTLQAFGLTLLLSAPWPLLLATVGWQLDSSLEHTVFSKAVSQGILWLTPAFFYLLAFRVMCEPGGLAAAHFRWPKISLQLLRREINRLIMVFLPAAFVAILFIRFQLGELGGGIERLAFIVVLIAFSVFLYHLFVPKEGVLHGFLTRHRTSLFARLRYLWLTLALALPLLLAGLALSGYLYTAATLTGRLIETLWLILGLIVFHQLSVRWLLLTRRKLALEAALERQEAARAAEKQQVSASPGEEDVPVKLEEPEVNLTALSLESRKLLDTTMVIGAIIGLWLIWSVVLPAFGQFGEIVLWHSTDTVAGEEKLANVTMADAVLAMLIAIVTLVAMKRLPALLEIILLKRLDMPLGSRYTATTLSGYFIAATGILVALDTIGASWSQIQWLAAALSVGIGFGLQEIVANFISGIIILFERPIRVGDFVTVGDTDGHVTRIRIRATTIQTRDRKELLVPNKEFITGRLLNWSLSDQMTRIILPVGIGYGSNVKLAMSLMREVAIQNERVLKEPEPRVIFESFGDNALTLTLRCFIESVDYRMAIVSELHEAINDKFNSAEVQIPFPQRDLHIDTIQPLDIRIQPDSSLK